MQKAYSYIRMSSEKQLRGDSLRRQLELSENYARENQLELVDNILGVKLSDLGVSGFRGVNSNKGVLSIFVNELEHGKIDKGSVLLIESLDRLSRDDITNALTQFLRILSLGIEIVTLADRQSYTQEKINNNPSQLYISLGVMHRANEESQTKSRRIGAAWSNKRKQAVNKPLTKKCPAWLKYSDINNCFELIPERAIVIRTIFNMCANTCGLWAITKFLNQSEIATFGNSKIWNKSYLTKIITNKAVMGEFQPHRMVNGKRVAEGEPIPDYFPSVVDKALYFQAQSARMARKTNAEGRKGNSFSNIFSKLLYCGYCGSKMAIRNRGELPKGGKTLVCYQKLQGAKCDMPNWKAPFVEDVIFKHLKEIEFSQLLGFQSETETIDTQINSIESQIRDKTVQINKLLDFENTTNLLDEIKNKMASKLNSLQTDINKLKIDKKNLELKKELLVTQNHIVKSEQLKKTLVMLEEKAEDYYFRSAVNQLLTKVIKRIDLLVDLPNYEPWEIEDELEIEGTSEILDQFQLENPSYTNHSLTDILKLTQFKNFYLQYGKRIRITYISGDTRHIYLGKNTSIFLNQSRLREIINNMSDA